MPPIPSIQIPSIGRCFTMTPMDSLILKKPLFLVQPEWFDDVWPVKKINQPIQVIQLMMVRIGELLPQWPSSSI